MNETDNYPAFSAFMNQLKTLCLTEFPCGIGSWRERNKTNTDSRFFVTLKDYGEQYEKTEKLEELIKDKPSPWCLDYSWSDEARALREIAVKSPWLVDDKYILNHFKTLRIIDKQITDVDERLLDFTNLEELTLSANKLQGVNSKNLPRSLKVLELSANDISDLFLLCVKPPLLTHLGLAYNQLLFIDDYITGDYWPQLLSLDLSHNNLGDLLEVVRKLASLPKLRNLVLQGNPLSLVPAYRGYTVDTLKDLCYLDDVGITADERHHFKGLAKRKEYVLDESKMIFRAGYIKNIPMPDELKNPEDQPEYPVVIRNYYVQFMFLKDNSSKAEIFQITHDDLSLGHTEEDGMTNGFSIKDDQSVVDRSPDVPVGDVEKNVNFADETETIDNKAAPQIAADTNVESVPIDSPEENEHEKLLNGNITLTAIQTSKINWSAEEMILDWALKVTRDDLLALRDFFHLGMDVQVVEEKILAYPAEDFDNPDGTSPAGSQRSGGKGDKKDKKKDEKDKGKSPVGKHKKDSTSSKGKKESAGKKVDDKGKKDAKGKKKKEPEIELKHMPAEYTTLATFHASLKDFLEGEYLYENIFVDSEGTSLAPTPVPQLQVKERKKSAEKKDKGKDKDTKERGKSPKGKDKGDKGKDKGKDGKKDQTHGKKGKESRAGKADSVGKKAADLNAEDDDIPLPPLEIQVALELVHWSTAHDALKADEPLDSDGDIQE